MSEPVKYYQRTTSAMIRGDLSSQYQGHELFTKFLDDLTEDEHKQLVAIGTQHQLRLNTFHRVSPLPETIKLLDILRGIAPDNVLDIGSGRGAFIWRMLDEYKYMPITSIDTSDLRVENIRAVSKGGINNLSVKKMDATDLSFFPNQGFDVTTVLKVLEYIEDVEKAVNEICRVTKRFIIVLFPAHKDNNTDKKHFFEPQELVALFKQNDIMQVKVEEMSNYNMIVARK